MLWEAKLLAVGETPTGVWQGLGAAGSRARDLPFFKKEYILLLVKGVSPTASSAVYHCSFCIDADH